MQSDFSCLCSSQIFDSCRAAIGTGSCYLAAIPEWQWTHLPLVSRRSDLTYSDLTYSALNTGSVYQPGPALHRWRSSTRKQPSGQTTPCKGRPVRTQTYKPDNVCNASISSVTGEMPVPAISAEGAQRINLQPLYNTIYCTCQEIISIFCVV